MRVALVVSGSRGDIQPMLALAVGLAAAGHDAIVCASPDVEASAREHDCAFVPIGESLRNNESLGTWGFGAFNRFIRHQIELQVRDLPHLLAGCDRVVASGLVWGVGAVAERLGVPYRYVSFVPAAFLGTTRDPLGTRVTRWVADRYAERVYGSTLNRARSSLGLSRSRGVMRQLMGEATIAATDPALTLLPRGAQLLTTQTGYPILAQRDELTEALRDFLAAGPPPIYAGFGSMPVARRERISRMLLQAAEQTGQRLVVSRGWAGLGARGHRGAHLFVDDEPHSVLFPQVAAVIHHGGAGTVATAARAGVPQIVLPAAADQFLWRGELARLGLGPRAPSLRFANATSLARAIAAVLGDGRYRSRAVEVAARLREAPDGVTTTVAEITRR